MFGIVKEFIFGRKQNIKAEKIEHSTIVQISGDVNYNGIDKGSLLTEVSGNKLVHRMVATNIDNYTDLLLNLRMKKLKQELDVAFSYGLVKLDDNEKEKIYFLRFCQALHDDEIDNCQVALDILSGIYKDEALWLKDFWDKPFEIELNDFFKHLSESQILVIDKLFSVGYYNKIIDIYNEFTINKDRISLVETVYNQLKYHCGLSMFNIGKFDESFKIFEDLKNVSREDKFDFFFNIVKIQKVNVCFIDERNEKELVQAKQGLDEVENKYPDLAKANEELVSYLKLLVRFNLGRIKICYLDNVKELYQGFSQEIKKLDLIKFYYGCCLEIREEIEQAISCYLTCEWNDDPNISIRLFLCYIRIKDYDNIISKFDELKESEITLQHKGIFLLALYYKGDKAYCEKLQDVLKTANKTFEDLFYVAFYVFDKKIFEDIIVKTINEMLYSGISFKGIDNNILTGFIYMFLNFKKMNLLANVLDEVTSLSIFSHETDYEIFYYFDDTLKGITKNRSLSVQPEVKLIEKIADRFIKENVAKVEFLAIKIKCLEKAQKYFSMLKYSKELFEIEPDPNVAANIVALSLQQKIIDADYYTPYLKAIYDSNVPGHFMRAAFVLKALGRMGEADYYAYKALYYLNGKDDYEIYGEIFRYYLQINEHKNTDLNLKHASGNTVLTLEDSENKEKLLICLDSEADLNIENNRSMDVNHINRKNSLYSKLVSSSIEQVLKIKEERYKVCEIVDRNVFAFRFVMRKINEHPEQFNKYIWPITGNSMEDMVEQIKKVLLESKERNDYLLDLYSFKNNSIGIPIDWLIDGEYDRYIDAVIHLLYSKDLAYYAGNETYEDSLEDTYVISLSTLILLAMKEWLYILDPILDRIACPESYISFFQNLLDEERKKQDVSPGLIALDNNNIAILNYDESVPEKLEKIIDECKKFKVVCVKEEERINYEIIDGCLKAEIMVADMKTNVVQMDAFILSSKLDAKYVCDDLFFRKLAAQKGIKNTNFSSLLRLLVDLDTSVPIIIELSKTNYISMPFLFRNDEEAKEILKNLTNSKIKREYYKHIKKQFEINERFFTKARLNCSKGN
jgi:hypothetical protein